MLAVTEQAGARLINGDRMWHYVEGIQNWDPVWPIHGIRILPGPSSVWLDATGQRLPVPLFPGFDTLGTLAHLRTTGLRPLVVRAVAADHREGVHALGQRAEPRPHRQGRARCWSSRASARAPPGPVQAFMDKGADFVVRDTLDELIAGMQALPGGDALDAERVRVEVEARDREIDNDFTKDAQIAMLRSARAYRGDRLDPHREPAPHPRSRRPARSSRSSCTSSPASRSAASRPTSTAAPSAPGGEPIPGLYAAGEASGFGGGGVHGYRALEGTFVGGCLFSGRIAGPGGRRAPSSSRGVRRASRARRSCPIRAGPRTMT